MTTNQSQYEEMIIPVRCKDCIHANNEVYQNEEVWLCRCHKYSHIVEPNDYCSHGERGEA